MLPVAILAGGLGTRLGPLTAAIPKALIPLNGEPFLAHQLRLLRRHGMERVVLCVGYLGEMIRDFAGDGAAFGLRVEYSFDGPELRGTAGAIRNALPLLGEAFFVLYGDSYLPCDYEAVAQAFAASSKQALMTVLKNCDRWDRSNVEFADGRILAYSKAERTSAMRHIDYGLGAFRRELMESTTAPDLAHVYAEALARGELAAYEVNQRFYEIGSPEGLRETAEFLRQYPQA
jgi:NDP-sugar pyrophosphorylase family protein